MAKGKVCTVLVTGLADGDEWFGETRQSDTNNDWRGALQAARNNKAQVRVFCLCEAKNKDNSLCRLVVSYVEAKDKFYLSAWPFTGGQHQHNCRFYSIWQDESSAKAYSSGMTVTSTSGWSTDTDCAYRYRTGPVSPGAASYGQLPGVAAWRPPHNVSDEKPYACPATTGAQ